MTVGQLLVNHSKREKILFVHVPASTESELLSHPAACAIVTAYMLSSPGDEISFISDTYDDWPFSSGKKSDLSEYTDVTQRVVDALVSGGHLIDHGRIEYLPEEPGQEYDRDLRFPSSQGPS